MMGIFLKHLVTSVSCKLLARIGERNVEHAAYRMTRRLQAARAAYSRAVIIIIKYYRRPVVNILCVIK